jgi:ComF family protein
VRRPAAIGRAAVDALIAVLVAPACAACGEPHGEPTRGAVCPACWAAIVPFSPPLCERCGDPLPSWRPISVGEGRCPRCRRRAGAVTLTRAIGEYDGALRAVVHALKYGGRRQVAHNLGRLMRLYGGDVLSGADLVIPVPLHRRKRRARGFNQAELLARAVGMRCERLLRRTRNTPSQTDLPAGRRHANVRGAFRLTRGADVRGLCVVVVDDVCTTGATLEACARVLRAAGAAEVRALTAARAVSRRR